MAKVLIVGGTGNISTAITRELCARGDDVYFIHSKKSNPFPQATEIVGDVNQEETKQYAVDHHGPFDCVIDMLGFTRENAAHDIKVFANKTKQFLFCSTINVFTAPAEKIPVTNDAPRYPDPAFGYAYEKAEMERMFEGAQKDGAFALTIIRPSYTYNDGRLQFSMVDRSAKGAQVNTTRLIEGKPILVPGDGNSIWCSSHRDDVAAAFVGAVMNGKAFGKAYSLSADERMTWEQAYRIAARVWGGPEPTFVHMASDLAQMCLPRRCEWVDLNFRHHVLFDSTEAKKDLGYRYRITWEEGCRRNVEYWNERGGFVRAYDSAYDALIENYEMMKKQLSRKMRELGYE